MTQYLNIRTLFHIWSYILAGRPAVRNAQVLRCGQVPTTRTTTNPVFRTRPQVIAPQYVPHRKHSNTGQTQPTATADGFDRPAAARPSVVVPLWFPGALTSAFSAVANGNMTGLYLEEMVPKGKAFTAAQVVRITGIRYQTLNHWVKIGLVNVGAK